MPVFVQHLVLWVLVPSGFSRAYSKIVRPSCPATDSSYVM